MSTSLTSNLKSLDLFVQHFILIPNTEFSIKSYVCPEIFAPVQNFFCINSFLPIYSDNTAYLKVYRVSNYKAKWCDSSLLSSPIFSMQAKDHHKFHPSLTLSLMVIGFSQEPFRQSD